MVVAVSRRRGFLEARRVPARLIRRKKVVEPRGAGRFSLRNLLLSGRHALVKSSILSSPRPAPRAFLAVTGVTRLRLYLRVGEFQCEPRDPPGIVLSRPSSCANSATVSETRFASHLTPGVFIKAPGTSSIAEHCERNISAEVYTI